MGWGGKRAVVERQEKWKLKQTHCGGSASVAPFYKRKRQKGSEQLPHEGGKLMILYILEARSLMRSFQ